MIQAMVRMVVGPGKEDEALRILQSITERTRVEAGCIECSLCRDAEDGRVMVLQQLWKGEKELFRHLGSDEYRNVLLVMEMCSEEPAVRFDTIVDSSGVETIEAARKIKKNAE